jgi:ABC-type antimicrobial peptide transport system permease subunit
MVGGDTSWLRVIGVVSQVHEEWELADSWYLPVTASTSARLYLVVRTDGPVDGVAGRVRPIVWEVDPDQPVERVVTFPNLVRETYTSERAGPLVVGSFAGVGLLLSVLGIYGVVSYTVRRSMRELGIRMALGAGAAGVRALVLRQGAKLVGLGLLIGVVGAGMLTRGLAAFLGGNGPIAVHTLGEVGRLGPADYAFVVVLLGGVTLLACWLPARRAARMEPAAVLRDE